MEKFFTSFFQEMSRKYDIGHPTREGISDNCELIEHFKERKKVSSESRPQEYASNCPDFLSDPYAST
jgi:hypothetical protein